MSKAPSSPEELSISILDAMNKSLVALDAYIGTQLLVQAGNNNGFVNRDSEDFKKLQYTSLNALKQGKDAGANVVRIPQSQAEILKNLQESKLEQTNPKLYKKNFR